MVLAGFHVQSRLFNNLFFISYVLSIQVIFCNKDWIAFSQYIILFNYSELFFTKDIHFQCSKTNKNSNIQLKIETFLNILFLAKTLMKKLKIVKMAKQLKPDLL